MSIFEQSKKESLAKDLSKALGLEVYASSVTIREQAVWFLAGKDCQKSVGLAVPKNSPYPAWEQLSGQARQINLEGQELQVKTAATDPANAVIVRENLSFTAPRLIGLSKSFGAGDRLGLASPGHIRAIRGKGMQVCLAQQSIREMARTRRSPQEIVDAATWATLQEGFEQGYGADADHLKGAEDIDRCLAAGFTFFTIDPGAHVVDQADDFGSTQLQGYFDKIEWEQLETTSNECLAGYADKTVQLPDGVALAISKEKICRAAVKYGSAVAHTVKMHRHLLSKSKADEFELEMSVDETNSPTSLAEHFYVASELRRLGVRPVSLAPRFVGAFEKGVDYIGDLAEFEKALVGHVAIAKHLGPYKISFHSGSDKFSIYPIAARVAGELVHVKTAGTSYLEALRCIGTVEPGLFREILAFALERYDEDRATYHVSAVASKVPGPDDLKDSELRGVLELFDGREVLHVTYGSVLQAENADGTMRFKDRLLKALQSHEEEHYAILGTHISRHVDPFC